MNLLVCFGLLGLTFISLVGAANVPAVFKMAPPSQENVFDFVSHKPWQDFKQQFNKVYVDNAEEGERFANFLDHSAYIESHNKLFTSGLKSYSLALNHFADMSHAEWKQHVGGCLLRQHLSRKTKGSLFLTPTNMKAPVQVDWRDQGYVTPVKNQGQCGSCWSFSTTGALEGQNFRKSGQLVSLSEQQLVDCSQSFGNNGCNGGLMDYAFQYIKSVGGIESEDDYPYIDTPGPQPESCNFDQSKVVATDTGFVDIPSGDENALMDAVASVGPVSVAIDASQRSFMLYSQGIYDEPNCDSMSLDHGVLTVGYGVAGSKKFWIVKNSWSTNWGEQGYIRMSRNKNNQCGIATKASYPLV